MKCHGKRRFKLKNVRTLSKDKHSDILQKARMLYLLILMI